MQPVTSRRGARRFLAILVACCALAACENLRDPSVLVSQGARVLDADEVRARVAGNTELWSEGSVYYDPGGDLEMIWRKVKSKGQWTVSPEGTVCFEVPKWTETCHYYLEHENRIITVSGARVRGAFEVVPGKQLPR